MDDQQPRINLVWCQPPVPRRRLRHYPEDWKTQFLAALAEERQIKGAALRIGVSRGSVYYGKLVDRTFARELANVLATIRAEKN